MYLQWQSTWWIKQSDRRASTATAELQEGLAAYAAKQASLFERLRKRFADVWYPHLQAFQLSPDWVLDQSLGLRQTMSATASRGGIDTVD